MKPHVLPINTILAFGLLASLCLHLLISRFVVFIFPAMRESTKPSIVFHGSFLKSLDVALPTEKGTAFSAAIQSKWKDVGETPYQHAQLSKPQSQNAQSVAEKETPRSIFTLLPEEQREIDLPDDLGIDTQTKPYEPLRFHR